MRFGRAVLAAVSGLALAAMAAPAQAYDFDGFYAGVQAGYGWGNAEQAFDGVPSPTEEADFDGFVGGVHLGYNLRTESGLVLGLEADAELNDQKGDDGGNGGHVNGLDGNWQASLRARAGFLIAPSTLIYATGGVVFLDADSTKEPAPEESGSLSYTSWTVGGGIEMSLAPNVSGRIEYRHADFGDDDVYLPIANYAVEISPASDQVRIGVSFDF